jgi:hypothetical protein
LEEASYWYYYVLGFYPLDLVYACLFPPSFPEHVCQVPSGKL